MSFRTEIESTSVHGSSFAISIVAYSGGSGFLLTYALTNIEFLSNSTAFIAVQMIGIVGAVGTLLVLINAVLAWISPRWRIWGKLQATILALACIGFLWFAYAGNLLHITTSY